MADLQEGSSIDTQTSGKDLFFSESIEMQSRAGVYTSYHSKLRLQKGYKWV
jgi:hypothetical protein